MKNHRKGANSTTFEKERFGQGGKIERHPRRPVHQMIPFHENRAPFIHEKDSNDDVAKRLHRPSATPSAVVEDENGLERGRLERVVIVVAESLSVVVS